MALEEAPDRSDRDVRATADEPVRLALQRLLDDPRFKVSDRNRRFLRFVVEEMLAGRSEKIKSYTVAVDVFGRDERFDPAVDPIVRIEATRLRAALATYYSGPGQSEPIQIELPKGGYVPAFKAIEANVAEVPSSKRVPSQTVNGSASAGVRPTRKGRAVLLLALAAMVAAGAAALGYAVLRGDPPATASLVLLEQTTPVTGESLEAQSARGLGQSILMALTRFSGLRVIAVGSAEERASVVRGQEKPGQAAYVVASTISMKQDLLRVWWSLANAATGEVIWSDVVDRSPGGGSTIPLEDEIAAAIASRVGAPTGIVSMREIRLQATQPTAAYGCVLRARGYYDSYTQAEHAEIRACLEDTVERTPDYADAWAMLAFVYLDEDRNDYNTRVSKEDASRRALEAARRAVQLAPYSDLAHEALMVVLYRRGDFQGAEGAGRRALELNPNNPEIKSELGIRLFARGQWDEGAAMVREAAAESIHVPPLNRFTLAFDHYRKADYADALAEAQMIEMPGFYATHMLLAAIYGQMGREEDARRAVQELLRLRPNFAQEMQENLRSRHYTEPLIAMLAEGVRKAGLDVR